MKNLLGVSSFCFAALLLTVLAVSVRAAETRPPCVKQTLVEFLSGGKPVDSEIVNTEDRWDADCSFGGNKVYTPKRRIYVYVNFNIRGTVDLDAIDAAFEAHAAGKPHGEWLADPDNHFGIAFVKAAWFERMFGVPDAYPNARMNPARNTIFVSEAALEKGELARIWADFFSQGDIWTPLRIQPLPERVKISVPLFY